MADRKIHILPEVLTNKIAAGEVVQRPASVVKELVENSIDAGAGQIEVIIRDGGKSLIQVVDDGEGMSAADLEIAFNRYSTSKISTFEDLINIGTLGFRGEALASISSVSMVEVITRRKDDETAHRIRIEGGKIYPVEPASGVKGTKISVENLFFNTPARRKFLKGRTVEFRHIAEMMKRFALLRPEIGFRFIHGEREVFSVRNESLQERIGRLFGEEYAGKILPVNLSYRKYSLDGFIGNLGLVRNKPGEQYLFVNRRFINDRLMNNAIFAAYKNLLERGEYPFYVLKLELPASEVDVNVHPTKMEVKFKEEWEIYHFIKSAIEDSLKQIEGTIPSFHPSRSIRTTAPFNDQMQIRFGAHPQKSFSGGQARHADLGRTQTGSGRQNESEPAFSPSEWSRRAERIHTKNFEKDFIAFETEIWQVHNKYLISAIASGIVLIDQHAAHERILFEQALEAMETKPRAGQQLLFPQVVEFSAEDYSVLLEIIPYLKKIGFHFSEIGKNSIMIDTVPPEMKWGQEGKAIREIIDHYLEYGKEETSVQKRVAASYACKAAIKAGDVLTPEERRTLVDRLFSTQNPYYCPHGRPVIVNLTLDELDKRFERK